MTFLDKLTKEHPDLSEAIHCPHDFGYEDNDKCPKDCDGNLMTCTACWNREIPGEKEEKENKPMKKTKAMLEEELDQKKNEIEELKKELVKVEKYKQYDDMAGEIKAIYDSFVNAGFNNDQAYEILIILLQNQKAASNSWESYLSKYLSMRRK